MQSLESRSLFEPLGSLINTRQAIFRNSDFPRPSEYLDCSPRNGRLRKRISDMVKVDNELSIFIYHNVIRCDRLLSVTLATGNLLF